MIHETFILRKQFPDATLTTYICDPDTNERLAPRLYLAHLCRPRCARTKFFAFGKRHA